MNGRVARILAPLILSSAIALQAQAQGSVSHSPSSHRAQAYVDAQFRPVFSGVSVKGDWLASEQSTVVARVCSSSPDMKIAIARRVLSETERKACDNAGRSAVFQKQIGAIVVTPVAQPGAFAKLTLRHIFESVAAEEGGGRPNRRMKWSEVDPALPDAPIRLLLPAAGSPEDSVFTAALVRLCLSQLPSAAGLSVVERLAQCARMRSDAAVARASAAQSASAWLAAAGPGGVALVGYGQLAADAALTGVVPLDGVLPQSGLRTRDDYAMSQPVYLVVSHKGRNRPESDDRAAALADSVLAEAAIGPGGRAALEGLAPLSAAERVALRKEFAQFLAKGSLWSGLWK